MNIIDILLYLTVALLGAIIWKLVYPNIMSKDDTDIGRYVPARVECNLLISKEIGEVCEIEGKEPHGNDRFMYILRGTTGKEYRQVFKRGEVIPFDYEQTHIPDGPIVFTTISSLDDNQPSPYKNYTTKQLLEKMGEESRRASEAKGEERRLKAAKDSDLDRLLTKTGIIKEQSAPQIVK